MKWWWISVCLLVSCGEDVVQTSERGDDGESREFVEPKDTQELASDTMAIQPLIDTASEPTDEKLLANGLDIHWDQKGNGKQIAPGDVVAFHYDLFNEGGHKLSTSREKIGHPVAVIQGLKMVTPGLDEALVELTEGDRARVIIPPELGLEDADASGMVGADENLYYDVEIDRIVEGEKLESGVIIYKVFEGRGAKVENGDKVGIDYFGFTDKGKPFDTSRKGGGSYEVTVGTGRVSEGLDEALAHLQINDQVFVKIPAHLGFGEKGLQDLVPPNTDIIYLVTVDYKK